MVPQGALGRCPGPPSPWLDGGLGLVCPSEKLSVLRFSESNPGGSASTAQIAVQGRVVPAWHKRFRLILSTLAVSAMRVSTLMDGEPTYHAMVALPSVLLHDIGLVLVHGVMRVAPSCDPLRDDDDGATLGLWLRRGSQSRAWVGESPLCLHPAPFASCIPSPNAKD